MRYKNSVDRVQRMGHRRHLTEDTLRKKGSAGRKLAAAALRKIHREKSKWAGRR